MFNRPRCRDWIPLASQQLRLRNLIRITGHNIIPNNKKSQLYYSLHYNINDNAFYISEKLDSHGNCNFNWNEINSPIILKSMAQCICIKIWEHYPIKLINDQNTNNDQMTQLNTATDNDTIIMNNFTDKEQIMRIRSSKSELCNNIIDNDHQQNNDKIIFIWGVYFSGLILLTKFNNDVKFINNSISLQMQGGHFVSPYSLTQETMRQQLSINYQLDSSKNDNINKFKIIGTNCDIIKTNNNSNNSNINNSISNNQNKILTTKRIDVLNNDNINYNRDYEINSPRTSRSCSPVRNNDKIKNNIDHLVNKQQYSNSVITTAAAATTTTTTTKTSDIYSNDLLNMLKIRFLDKKFHKLEIQQSYTLDKLLQLQKKQRQIKQCTEDAKDITEKICMKSAFCLNLELISNKGIYYQRKSNPSMGRALNRLLFQQVHVKPEDILKAQDLRRKIETAKFRSKLLLEEHDNLKNNCHKYKKKLNDLHDNNIELESWLMSCYRNLGREKDILDNEKINLNDRREQLKRIQKALRQRKAQLCGEIKEIYPIERKCAEIYTISQIYLPNAEELSIVTSTDGIFEVTPLSLSSALGYVAHALKMCSIVLNLPLRNPINHEGSRSRIIDVVKEIPNSTREFPLYSRTIPPPKPVLYAIYLLNQNIAQLNVQANGIMHCDLRMTLSNLLLLLNGPRTMGNFLLQLPNSEEYSNNLETTSISNSSVDLNVVPVPSICSSKPVDVVDMKLNEQRISRSVGSYSDEQLSANNDKGFYNSEPMLTTHPVAVHLTSFSDNGNI